MIEEMFEGMGIVFAILLLTILIIPLALVFGVLWVFMLYLFIGRAAIPLGFVLGFFTAIGWILQEQ